ncbi:flagellar biosynthesis protein FliQ [Pseudomonas sp. 148P]|uniref:Flagellar biosynthetic protein FliQ n=1 Tax=Pseudomonas ulcerans TaxID=3115852 RepID=A0ABU7HJJ8_9PSED|nr:MULTISPECIES: flagellar biosynthesis protein FliQ [unclassified Pseudomonas]MEE1921424.1 flagellar biosynthesis protein FliQ [Pseudomonas sp. 147P]MEE1931707.1 flagellar biosynthesis protein FliQ [Pseudomonas sp. 148P]
MTPEMVMDLAYKGMRMSMTMAAPLLLVTLCVGLLVSLFQAATQINESTLSFIPKVVAVCLVLILAGPMLMEMLVDYTRALFTSLPSLIG